MKKLFSMICLFLAISTGYAQNFVPDPSVMYNIVQTNSNLVVGPAISGGFSTTQPVVLTLTNQSSQAFFFIPVAGKTDTYYLQDGEGKYLNKVSNVTWDSWSVIFEPTTTDLNSEWVISGPDATGIRLMLNANSKYLASDAITSGSSLYCDKAVDNANGLFSLKVATIDNTPVFSVLDKNLVIEIEKDLQPYPLEIFATGQNYNINATVSAGYTLSKSTFTPTDFTAGSGKAQVVIMATTAAVGDTGTVVFSYTLGGVTNNLDTVKVTPVKSYERYFITNKACGLVVSSDSINNPALEVSNLENYKQYFLLRPVHPAIIDSLFYIVQDGEYAMLKKVATSGWNTEYGHASDEAIWKMVKQANGAYSISNFVTGKALGTDDIIVNSRLYDDKTFTADPTAKPYCEWSLVSLSESTDKTNSELSSVSLSAGLLNQSFESAVHSYDVLAPADENSITITGTSKSTVAFIDNNSAAVSTDSPTANVSCVSGDGLSTTIYSFKYAQLSFSDWAARGETNSTRSNPSQWGWKCANATWVSANSTTAGTVRYIDNPVNYFSLADTTSSGVLKDTIAYKGRIMYVRWDGAVGDSGVYSYPVKLEGAKTYTFSGKYAWNSVVPADTTATFTFGINTASDNSGTSVCSNDFTVASTDLLDLHNASFTFTPTTSGIYYFTVKNNVTLLGALADLSIVEGTTAIQNVDAPRTLYAVKTGQSVHVHGTNMGDNLSVYNVNGQLIKQLKAGSDITTINLKSGIYLIKVNTVVLKVIL
ncbi:MAG: T9SS type A sorting domain-containing protein [Paludibacter sp.]|nr:T9SS type A sorting domain-containing protein [Paludibacter sp.]